MISADAVASTPDHDQHEPARHRKEGDQQLSREPARSGLGDRPGHRRRRARGGSRRGRRFLARSRSRRRRRNRGGSRRGRRFLARSRSRRRRTASGPPRSPIPRPPPQPSSDRRGRRLRRSSRSRVGAAAVADSSPAAAAGVGAAAIADSSPMTSVVVVGATSGHAGACGNVTAYVASVGLTHVQPAGSSTGGGAPCGPGQRHPDRQSRPGRRPTPPTRTRRGRWR